MRSALGYGLHIFRSAERPVYGTPVAPSTGTASTGGVGSSAGSGHGFDDRVEFPEAVDLHEVDLLS